jgi:hypothetical protein
VGLEVGPEAPEALYAGGWRAEAEPKRVFWFEGTKALEKSRFEIHGLALGFFGSVDELGERRAMKNCLHTLDGLIPAGSDLIGADDLAGLILICTLKVVMQLLGGAFQDLEDLGD